MKNFLFILIVLKSFLNAGAPGCGGGYAYIQLMGELGIINSQPSDTQEGWHCFAANGADYWYNCRKENSTNPDSTVICDRKRYALTNSPQCSAGKDINPSSGQCECLPPDGYPMELSGLADTQGDCNMGNPALIVPDNSLQYVSSVIWSNCDNMCYASLQTCSRGLVIIGGNCQTPPPPADSCTGTKSTSFGGITSGNDVGQCYRHYLCDGVEYARLQVSCGNPGDADPSNGDTNSSGSGDSGDSGGSSGPGDSGNSSGSSGSVDSSGTITDGDSGDSGGDTNSSSSGGSGDSSGTGTLVDPSLLGADDFNTSLSDVDKMVKSIKEQITEFQGNIENTLNDISDKYNDTKDYFINGTPPPVMSVGGSIDCASFNFHGRHITLDLSKAAIIQPLVYYLFTAFFMFLNFMFLVNHLFRGLD